jgi:hypothetical protein
MTHSAGAFQRKTRKHDRDLEHLMVMRTAIQASLERLADPGLAGRIRAWDMCAMETLMWLHSCVLHRTARAILRDDRGREAKAIPC